MDLFSVIGRITLLEEKVRMLEIENTELKYSVNVQRPTQATNNSRQNDFSLGSLHSNTDVISTLQTQVEAIHGDIEALKVGQASAQSTITALSSRIKDGEVKQSSLKKKLDTVRKELEEKILANQSSIENKVVEIKEATEKNQHDLQDLDRRGTDMAANAERLYHASTNLNKCLQSQLEQHEQEISNLGSKLSEMEEKIDQNDANGNPAALFKASLKTKSAISANDVSYRLEKIDTMYADIGNIFNAKVCELQPKTDGRYVLGLRSCQHNDGELKFSIRRNGELSYLGKTGGQGEVINAVTPRLLKKGDQLGIEVVRSKGNAQIRWLMFYGWYLCNSSQ